MRNGKERIINKTTLTVTYIFCCLISFSQKKDSSRSVADYPSFKIETECKSKSERTTKPTVIKIAKTKLGEVKTVKDLIQEVPKHCEIICVFISIKKPDDKVFEFINIGNEMVYASRLPQGKYIIVDNLVSSCPLQHKANYKIMIE
jgi:hypothetical protein